MSSKFYLKHVLEILIPSSNDLAIIYKVQNLKDNFINGLEKIIKQKQFTWFKKKRNNVFNIHQKTINKNLKMSLQSKRLKKINTWLELSKKKNNKNANLIKSEFINKKKNHNIKINAIVSIHNLFNKLAVRGFFHFNRNQPIANMSLTFIIDHDIIENYNFIIYNLLNYYRPSDNYFQIKSLIENMKHSCILTLKTKYKKRLTRAYLTAKKNIKLNSLSINKKINKMDQKFNSNQTKKIDINEILQKFKFRQSKKNQFFSKCSILKCKNNDIEIHHIRKLEKKKNSVYSIININDVKGKLVKGISAILSAIEKKQLPFCNQHHQEFEKSIFSSIDTDFLNNLFDTKIPNSFELQKAFEIGQYTLENSKQR